MCNLGCCVGALNYCGYEKTTWRESGCSTTLKHLFLSFWGNTLVVEKCGESTLVAHNLFLPHCFPTPNHAPRHSKPSHSLGLSRTCLLSQAHVRYRLFHHVYSVLKHLHATCTKHHSCRYWFAGSSRQLFKRLSSICRVNKNILVHLLLICKLCWNETSLLNLFHMH